MDVSNPPVDGRPDLGDRAIIDRRRALRRLALAGGVGLAWAVPTVQYLGTVVAVAASAPPGRRVTGDGPGGGAGRGRSVRPTVGVERAASAADVRSHSADDALKVRATALNVAVSGAMMREVAVRRADARRAEGLEPPPSAPTI
ncbi:MAG TPA: hypothetical protein VHF25_15755 [Nitriliruptorales bacterium]|nr:hypothetical protein [Nitriliruptorales bacterium]